MFSEQSNLLHELVRTGDMSPKGVAILQQVIGHCTQALTHRGPVEISPAMDENATQGALTVNAFVDGLGDQRWEEGLYGRGKIHLNGQVEMYGPQVNFLPIGTIIPFYPVTGGPTLAEVTAGGTWALADGTNGTVDLRAYFLVGHKSGDADFGTAGGTGGSKTGTHTFTTDSDGSGTTGSGGTGATGASGGTTDSATTGIDIVTTTLTFTPTLVTAGGAVNAFTAVTPNPHDHSVTDGGHTHGIGSHTHTGPSHTHTTPAHTHAGTTAAGSHLNPFTVVYFLQRIA